MDEQFFQLINSKGLRKGCLDIWKWKEDDKGVFSVNSAYYKMQGNSNEEVDNVFKMLWNIRVVPKSQLLGWRIFLDKLPTKDKLSDRGIQLQHNLCELCLASEESEKHLFFSCRVTQKVWNMCDRWLGASSVYHIKAKEKFKHFNIVTMMCAMFSKCAR